MSEKLHTKHESKEQHISTAEQTQKHLESLHQAAEKSKESMPKAQELSKIVEQQARSGKETPIQTAEKPKTQTYGTYSALKQHSYVRSLQLVRNKLSGPERALSKIAHNKTIDPVSEVMGKTIARPSGILGGGIAALAGSLFLLYMAKHYGFQYNFFVFFILFTVGFMIGSLVELLVWAIHSRKNTTN